MSYNFEDILVHSGWDSEEIAAVIYSWHKWAKTESRSLLSVPPTPFRHHNIILKSPRAPPSYTVLPTFDPLQLFFYLLLLVTLNHQQTETARPPYGPLFSAKLKPIYCTKYVIFKEDVLHFFVFWSSKLEMILWLCRLFI